MKQGPLFTVLGLGLLVLTACGPGQLLGPKVTPTPTQTPIPPTPTPSPTPTPIAGIEAPITVSGAQLLIVTATNDPNVYSTGTDPFVIQPSSPDDTVLYIEAEIVSGDLDLEAFSRTLSLTDETGTSHSLIGSGVEIPAWFFVVPKSSQSFTLHLDDGQTIVLDSILNMIP